jgi:hypothetical protein
MLRRRQLTALKSWVDAGGSVLVQPTGGLKKHHVQFLNELAGRKGPFSTEGGRLTRPASTPPGEPMLLHSELGRAAILFDPLDPERDLKRRAWRRMAAFLWKFNAVSASMVASAVPVQIDLPDPSNMYYYETRRRTETKPTSFVLSPTPLQNGGVFVQAVLPKTIRVVPLWLILLLSAIFIVAIGPLDYIALGLVKRRAYTWVLFPAVSVAFTVVVVGLSAHYMGSTDYRKRMEIVDVGEGGRVLRRNRLAVLFASREKEARSELSGCLFSDLTRSGFGWESGFGRTGGMPAAPFFSGRIPGGYTCTQQLRQWVPQVNRTLGVGADENAGEIDWSLIDPAGLASQGARRTMARELVGSVGGRGAVFFIHESRLYEAYNNIPREPEPRRGYYVEGSTYLFMEDGFVHQLCAAPERSLFSQTSPHGGGTLDDMAVVDPAAPEQWLLVVAVPDRDGYRVYRRLYRTRTHTPGQ